MKQYREKRTAERYTKAVELLGGVCAKCGIVDKFDFDHVDPKSKSFELSLHFWDYSWERLIPEIMKCQLLCKPCHIAKTSSERSVGHGGGLTGKRGCYCDLCRPLKYAYTARRRRIMGR